MNILYLCDEYPPCKHGGIGSITQILACEMVKKGHQVSVCGLYPYYRTALSFEVDRGVNVYRIFYGNWLLLKLSKHKFFGRFINCEHNFLEYVKFLKEFIIKNKINIIEIPDFNEIFRYTGPRFIRFPDFSIPSVIKLHSSYTLIDHIIGDHSSNKNIFRKEFYLIQHASKLLAVSEFTKKTVAELFSFTKEIAVIHNGIPVSDQIRISENSSHIVVFAGTLAEIKGVLSLIKVWDNVISVIPSANLFLYGKGGKNILKKINQLISDKTKESIHIKGFVSRSELVEIYRTASCAIFPSYVESFGMAPLESMQAGCPTIFTKRVSGGELIENGVTGFLVDPDNIQEISDALIKMLSDKEAAEKMGRRGAEFVKQKFNISTIADLHFDLYKSILK
jgi:glycogen(starch) synthase